MLVSRGELIEIGDGFRIPDVLERSGARLVEVGTTNRTRAADYERAVGPGTAALLAVHQSNFRVVGFTERPRLAELAAVAARHALPLVDDLGSGAFAPLEDEPTARESLAAGADLVTFSGDKLLGGPQAGIVVGRADLVERLRRHPLQRALRADKLTLAALEGTLALYLDPERAAREVPVLRMLREPVEAVRARAGRLAELVGGSVEETVARVGGGALPLAELASFACAVEEELAGPLRRGEPPVVAVVRDGRCLLDCRTLADAEVDEAAAAVARARGSSSPEATLWNLMRGALVTRALAIVADLRIADSLADGPRPVAELAREADPDSLHRFLRALASDGVFAEVSPGVFAQHGRVRAAAPRGLGRLRASLGGAWHRAAGELDATGEATLPADLRQRLLGVARREPGRASRVRPRDGAGQGAAARAARRGAAGAATRPSSTSAAATARCSLGYSPATRACAGSSSTCPRPCATRRRSATASSSSPATSS